MLWRVGFCFLFFLVHYSLSGQTNTATSGNWNDGSVWSTGTVPTGASTVNVNHPLIINSNITISTGIYTFNQTATDVSGGTAYTLTATTSGGVLDVVAGVLTFEGAATFDDATLFVRNGATLILGPTAVNNQTDITIEAGGTLIVNGTLTNQNDGVGVFLISGVVQVNGNYDAPIGSVSVSGTGDLFTTGTITTTESSDVFGKEQDCTSGPCSGRNLCGFSNSIVTNQTLCSSGTPTTLTGNSVGGSPIYSWESSTASSTTGFGLVSSGTQNYSPVSLTQTTWFRRKVTESGCNGISPPVQISVLPSSGGWKGVTNDWNTASNWCDNTIPTSSTDVLVYSGVSNMPQITATSQCRDLTINSGASVEISGSNTLSIFGNFINSGTFTPNTSTVSLVGTVQQTLSGKPTNFNSLIVNNFSGTFPEITANGFYNVLNTLTMTSGRINLSGYNFTLGTSAASPGALSYSGGRLYNGDLTRWFNTSAISLGDVAGMYPIGSETDNRHFYLGIPLLSVGGAIRIGHVASSTTSTVSVSDGGSTIVRRQDSYWPVAVVTGVTPIVINIFSLRGSGTGFGTIGDVDDLRLMLSSSVVGSVEPNGGTVTSPQVNRQELGKANLTNNFYVGSTNATSSPLPVVLAYFEGKLLNGFNRLYWKSLSEQNLDYFQVEKMRNGEFQAIGRISGTGFSMEKHEYEFLDTQLDEQDHYYRLKIVDHDGMYKYSKVIVLNTRSASKVFPNPVNDGQLNIQLENHQLPAVVALMDPLSKPIWEGVLSQSTDRIVLGQGILPGLYLLKISWKGGLESHKIIVE